MAEQPHNITQLIRAAAGSADANELLTAVAIGLTATGMALHDLSVAPSVALATTGRLVGHVEHFPLPHVPERLVIAWSGPPDSTDLVHTVVGLVDSRRRRTHLEEQLSRVRTRMDAAQRLAHVGDFEWNIATDTLTWSDELFRIYGLEPGSIDLSYDEFINRLHPDDRQCAREVHQEACRTGQPFRRTERIIRPDGDVRVLDSSGTIEADEDGVPLTMLGSCIDITVRSRSEQALRQSIDDVIALDVSIEQARLRQLHAVEINDNIVQGLSASVLAMESGRQELAEVYLQRTLSIARQMMVDLLIKDSSGALDPADLIRVTPATIDPDFAVPVEPFHEPVATAGKIRVLVVDDAQDLRFLLRTTLEQDERFIVIGEAGDGRDAIRQAARLQPDVILLDVAMPVMDGIAATPVLRDVSPQSAILVLSGFAEAAMSSRTIEAGASAYVEKGEAIENLRQLILSHMVS